MMPVAILCGGLATRMFPVTKRLPKSLIEIAGKPFIHRQLRLLADNGIRNAVLCVGNMGEMIYDTVGDGSRFGMQVEYSFDGECLLGTAGALKNALPLLPSAFFVLYGDSYLECDYQAIASEFDRSDTKFSTLMTVYRNDNEYDASNIVYRDGRIVLYDKKTSTGEMKHIDYGLSVLSAKTLTPVSLGQTTDLADILHRLVLGGEVLGYEVENRFYEIGSQIGLAELERHLHAISGE